MLDDSDLPKAWDHKLKEPHWRAYWQQDGLFTVDPSSDKTPYCIVMPPPNVTGALHMGHAFVNTLQDVLIRYKRMSGFEALWVPGLDHAGISTETVIERELIAKEGLRKHDLGREEFLKRVWQWKEQYGTRICEQLKMLGASCDWSKLAFTMDPHCQKAVRKAFKTFYDAGLIYRGDYLVNWDPVTQTAIADDEVEYETRSGFLWHIVYPLEDGSGSLTIATTRPETMLGDTAVAVNPSDRRYKHLIGKKLILPLVNRTIPIVADDFVDPAFGTGAVKVTPAHDPNDYQIAQRHLLPMINILTPQATIKEGYGPFSGLSVDEARLSVVEALKKTNQISHVEPHQLRIGLSYRSKAVIQPFLSKQWFLKMSAFKANLRALVYDERVKIIPPHWKSTYFHWIDNLRDWCISRQLWWGHRIPIWHHRLDKKKLICYEGVGTPPEAAKNPQDWHQDEDVLDTWFSSALWPFVTLGWPEHTSLYERFYPNSVLVTGHDILFFWVARMLLMGQYLTEQPPFPEVFLHGLIYGKSYWREKEEGGVQYLFGEERQKYENGASLPAGVCSKWEKMSKSKGNIIDPLQMIDTYGTDAVRLALCASATQLPQIDLDPRRFEEYKNFVNKIWNGARFVFLNLKKQELLPALTAESFAKGLDINHLLLEDRWILSRLNTVAGQVGAKIDAYALDEATQLAYDFFWKEFCAYYLEIAKPILFGKTKNEIHRHNKQQLLSILLCSCMQLLHPFAPFITEEIFKMLKHLVCKEGVEPDAKADLYTLATWRSLQSPGCCVSSFPTVVDFEDINESIEYNFQFIEKIVYAIRNMRGEMSLPPSMATDLYIIGDGPDAKVVKDNQNVITALVPTTSIFIETKEPTHLKLTGSALVGSLKVIIPLPIALQEKEKQRLQKEREKALISLEKVSAQLQNPDFIAKAQTAFLNKQKDLQSSLSAMIQEIESKLKDLL